MFFGTYVGGHEADSAFFPVLEAVFLRRRSANGHAVRSARQITLNRCLCGFPDSFASGGALALGVANHILMLENAVYSVLSPEGFASILWKDASRSGEACEMMKLTAQDLYSDGIVEQVIPEPLGGAQRSHAALFEQLCRNGRLSGLGGVIQLHLMFRSLPLRIRILSRTSRYRHVPRRSAPA